MQMKQALLSASVGCAALLLSAETAPVTAAGVVPPLGTAAGYMILGTNISATSGTVTCTDTGPGGNIDGNVGTTFTSITNTGCTITGTVDAPVAGAVVTDFNNAYSALASLNPACDGVIPTTSTTIPPGVYCSPAGTTIGTGVIFTLAGNATDVWIFIVGTSGLGALTGNGLQVVMGGSALPCNVFWWTAEAATMTDSSFIGTILSGSAISLTRGNLLGRALATTDITVTDQAPMTFAGCAAPATITVGKDFLPDSSATVPLALTCTSGTVVGAPLGASEGLPAVFAVGGCAITGTTCTATETVPAGYVADQSDCVGVPLGGTCTIVNTLLGSTVTVNKDFLPDSPAAVQVDLACTSGTVDNSPLLVSEMEPGIFIVNGAAAGVTCTATEIVPLGYTADQTNCLNVPLGGSCTILNTLLGNTVTVNKDFLPDSLGTVQVDLACTSGTVANTPLDVSETAPGVFVVDGAAAGVTCTASEVVPLGYTADETNCLIVPLGGSCTITNTLLSVVEIPTLSHGAMIVLAMFLALAGFAVMRRRTT